VIFFVNTGRFFRRFSRTNQRFSQTIILWGHLEKKYSKNEEKILATFGEKQIPFSSVLFTVFDMIFLKKREHLLTKVFLKCIFAAQEF